MGRKKRPQLSRWLYMRSQVPTRTPDFISYE
jgi:hypothetical protein